MTTAFVLSGGASLGSIQVGMLLAIAETGVVPDLIVGTSVGALNGAGSPHGPMSTASKVSPICGDPCRARTCFPPICRWDFSVS